ncbi:MAG: hypothetical protein WAO52_17445 [Prolixibacteraceae bacterium]
METELKDLTKTTFRDQSAAVTISLIALLIFCNQQLWSQTSNSDFERIKLSSEGFEYSGMALSPDMNTIAISTKNGSGIKLVDWNNQKITQTLDAGNWNNGSRISYSKSGKYLLLQEISNNDLSMNIKRETDFEIIDATSGKRIKKFDKIQDVTISTDEQHLVSLNGTEITFWSLPEGNKEKSFSVPNATNAIALDQEGKILAVSEKIDPEAIRDRFKKDKKGLKATVSYKQLVCLYDVDTQRKTNEISEYYDLIYELRFLPESDILFVFQTPDIRIQVANKKLSYVNQIDVAAKKALRMGFTSMSVFQPDLKISSDYKLFAVNSKGNRFQEMHVYNYETGELDKRFELGSRLFEKVEGEKLLHDSRPSFIILPDNQSILIAMGNQLVKWNIESEE